MAANICRRKYGNFHFEFLEFHFSNCVKLPADGRQEKTDVKNGAAFRPIAGAFKLANVEFHPDGEP